MTFAPFDRVIVTDLRTGTQHRGSVSEVGGDGFLVVKYDDGALVRVGRGFVSHDNPTVDELFQQHYPRGLDPHPDA